MEVGRQGVRQNMKKSLLSNVYFLLTASLLVTACGSGVQNGNSSKPPPPIQKPGDIAADEASSVLGLFMASEYSYIQDSLQLLIFSRSSYPCQRVSQRIGFPNKPGAVSSTARAVLKSQCNSSTADGADIQGREDISYENVSYEKDGGPLQFSRAYVQAFEPLQIRGKGLTSGSHLTVLQSFLLTKKQVVANTVQFDFEAKAQFRTYARQGSRGGKWNLRISGVATYNLDTSSWQIGQLINRIEAQLILRSSSAQTELETASLNATVPSTDLDSCGRPAGTWESVYSTSIFPGKTMSINFLSKPEHFENSTLSKSYLTTLCQKSESLWASDFVWAQKYLRSFRNL